MHVILATQRPSVDVITGMIKANFPTRIALQGQPREDSQTILGRQGAEHLLGRGDMLIKLTGASDLKRVQCPFISEDEVNALSDFLRAQGEPVYDENILKPRDDEDGDGGCGGEPDAATTRSTTSAVAIVAQAGYCSISHLQRQLGVGYNKAAKLVERMEKEGVVGPAERQGRRPPRRAGPSALARADVARCCGARPCASCLRLVESLLGFVREGSCYAFRESRRWRKRITSGAARVPEVPRRDSSASIDPTGLRVRAASCSIAIEDGLPNMLIDEAKPWPLERRRDD